MKLSLIGMSGSGKSYWSARLGERGFKRFCCDDLIEQKLGQALIGPDGSPMEVGDWMGFPYEARYAERAAKYLDYEIEVLTEICDYLEHSDNDIVVDTTGSAIYTGEAMMTKLRQGTIMVHLSTPLAVQTQMLRVYMMHQRPVLWNGFFQKVPGESNETALARCYPKLLASREDLYLHYADVVIDYHMRRSEGFDVDTFLDWVKR